MGFATKALCQTHQPQRPHCVPSKFPCHTRWTLIHVVMAMLRQRNGEKKKLRQTNYQEWFLVWKLNFPEASFTADWKGPEHKLHRTHSLNLFDSRCFSDVRAAGCTTTCHCYPGSSLAWRLSSFNLDVFDLNAFMAMACNTCHLQLEIQVHSQRAFRWLCLFFILTAIGSLVPIARHDPWSLCLQSIWSLAYGKKSHELKPLACTFFEHCTRWHFGSHLGILMHVLSARSECRGLKSEDVRRSRFSDFFLPVYSMTTIEYYMTYEWLCLNLLDSIRFFIASFALFDLPIHRLIQFFILYQWFQVCP